MEHLSVNNMSDEEEEESDNRSSLDLENECIRSSSTRTSFGSSSNNVPQPDEVIDNTLNQHRDDSMAECSTYPFSSFSPCYIASHADTWDMWVGKIEEN